MLTIRTNYLLNMILKVIFKVIQIIMWEVHRWQMKDYRRCVFHTCGTLIALQAIPHFLNAKGSLAECTILF